MAHEQIIKNGVIVEHTLQFLGEGHIVTGITNSGTAGTNPQNLVTENVVRNTVNGITLDDLSGVTITNPQYSDVLFFSGGTWKNVNMVDNDNWLDQVTADTLYLSLSGGTLTGNLQVNTLNVKTAIRLTGNTMVNGDIVYTGNLDGTTATIHTVNVQSAINLTGNTTIYGDIITSGLVDGVDISAQKLNFIAHTGATNPHNTALDDITNVNAPAPSYNDFLTYSGGTWINSPLSALDSRFVNVSGDTMTGPLVINYPGIAFTVNGNTNIIGDLFVSGTTTTVNSHNLVIKDNILTINSGETGSGVTMMTSGLRIDRGALVPYYIIFDEASDTFRIGLSPTSDSTQIVVSGSTQAVATRQDTPSSGGISYWNSSVFRMDTNPNITISGNNIVTSGLVDGVDVSALGSAFISHTGATNPHSTTVASLGDVLLNSVTDMDLLYYSGGTWKNSSLDGLADGRYVNTAGDTMTGKLVATDLDVNTSLNITGTTTIQGDIVTSGLVDGVDVSLLKSNFNSHTGSTNPHGTTVSSLGDVTITSVQAGDLLYYTGGTWKNTVLSTIADGRYVNTAGDTMTGDLTVTPLSGTTSSLIYADSAGKFQRSTDYITKTALGTIGAGTTSVDSFPVSLGKGCVWHYTLDDGVNFRGGTINAVWNGSVAEFFETATNDIGNTSEVIFDVNISGGVVRVQTIISGLETWSVSTSRFIIG